MKRIYLDHASLTPIDEEVRKEIEKYSSAEYGNASSLYTEGVFSKNAMEKARKSVGAILHAHPSGVVFTGGGTEANNLAILGLFKSMILKQKKKPAELHMITSKIEHTSVLECVSHLSSLGVKVDYVSVDQEGVVNLQELKEKLRPETFFVSIMYVNNEIGTIQPIAEISKLLRNFRKSSSASSSSFPLSTLNFPLFHVDACQAPLYLGLNTEQLGVDMLTLDGQKMNGPRGVGCLYMKRGVEIEPMILGGGQEKGLRSGTENIPAILGFAKALELADKRRDRDAKKVKGVRDYFISKLNQVIFPKVEGAVLNGSATDRTANNVNVSLPGIDNEFAVLTLDAKDIACSTKSSCLRDEDESYVLRALGVKKNIAKSSLRFSLGRETTKKEIDYVIKILAEVL